MRGKLRRIRGMEELAKRHRLGSLGGELPQGFPRALCGSAIEHPFRFIVVRS